MNRIIIVVLLILTQFSCKNLSDRQTINIKLKNDTTLILKKKIEQGNIWGIDLKISGNYKDTITLIHPNGNSRSNSNILFGGVDSKYKADWYSDSCIIKFKKVKNATVDIQIDYKFLDL